VTAALYNPNVSCIIPIGNLQNGRRTLQELAALVPGTDDETTARISRQTGLDFTVLRRFSQQRYRLRSICWPMTYVQPITTIVRGTGLKQAPTRGDCNELVYLAQSFHLFDDLGDREIARAIVASALE
jgi:hypothetical protein